MWYLVCGTPSAVRDLTGQGLYFSVVLMWVKHQPLNGLLQHYTVTYTVNGSSTVSAMSQATFFTVSNLYPNTEIANISSPEALLDSLTTLTRPGMLEYTTTII